jgi:hypothetical protein
MELPNWGKYKIDVLVKQGTHLQWKESNISDNSVNRQVNDKERVAAAMENKELMNFIDNMIK